MNEQKEILYHYCKLSTAIEFILPEMRLLLNPIINTNDPWENKTFYFGGYFSKNMSTNPMKKNETFSKILTNDCKVICFSEGRFFELGTGQPYEVFGFGVPSMWAHYGENHHGLCLAVDKNKFIEENAAIIDTTMLRKIDYVEPGKLTWNESKTIDYKRIQEIGEENYLVKEFRPKELHYLYFTKTTDWQYECETRLIYFSPNKEMEFCSIQNSLIGVTVGLDFNMNYLPSLKAHLPGKPIHAIKYVGGMFTHDRNLADDNS